MARLYITPREQDFVSDLNKELLIDILGETIILYPISDDKTNAHEVYDEAIDKIYENPIYVNANINWGETTTYSGKFGHEVKRTIQVFLHQKDILDRKIEINEGDFFSYGNKFYEIVSKISEKLQFGQVEYINGIKLIGSEARESQFKAALQGRMPETVTEEKLPFHQQRGVEENREGKTNDKRDLSDKGTLSVPITGPKEVSELGGNSDTPSFYD